MCHADTRYNGTLGEGKKGVRGRKQWYDGKHQAIISDELFEQCMEIRRRAGQNRHTFNEQKRIYLLNDRVYCAECIANKPDGLMDRYYGKMRPYWHKDRNKAFYRCRSKERGYESCEQGLIHVKELDRQVVTILSTLAIPEGFRERLERAVQSRVENEVTMKRMEEIRDIIQRVDFRWDRGYINPEEYVEKREQLELELESLRPIDYDELTEAADLIDNFRKYWDQCYDMEKPDEARQQLLKKIVERVFVYDGQVLEVVVHGDFGVVLGENEKASADIADALEGMLAAEGLDYYRSFDGSDGVGYLTRCRVYTYRTDCNSVVELQLAA